MTSIEIVKAVIAANQAVQMEARKWNVRAGENVFPVMTTDQWQEWLRPRLNGAISYATIPNPELLRIPALPADEVELIRKLNPDTITVLGREYVVSYNSGMEPAISLDDATMLNDNAWQNLPNEGVKLPGGRLVKLALRMPSHISIAETNMLTFKERVKNSLNQEQWDRFADWPIITAPNAIEDTTVLPEIAAAVYGTCAVTGEPLAAYGTLTASRYWSSDPIAWKAEWFRSRTDAEAAFSKAQAELEKAKVEARDKRDREAVQAAAAKAKERARELYGEMPYDNATDLRDRLYNRAYAYLPSGVSELRQWTTETEAVIADAEVATSEELRKREERLAEEARVQAEAEKQFGIIPEQLLSAFGDNKATAFAFMQKVANLPTRRLDEHVVVSCGRDRRRNHLLEVSGDQEFFLGADPNRVCWYVADVHFYQRHKYSEPAQATQEPVPASNAKGSLEALSEKWGGRLR